jgi:predicted dehydrogenase
VRIGIAGLGFGASVQIPAFRSIPGVEIAALLASRPERAAELAAITGATPCRSLAELLDQDLDAISLALPPKANEAALAVVLAQGVAVLSEKPLGADLAAVRRLGSQTAGRIIGVDFELAELDCFAALRAIIADDRFGRPSSAAIVWHARSRAFAERRWCWKTDAESGGGVLSLFGSHLFFLIEHVLGRITTLEARLAGHADFAPVGSAAAPDFVRLKLALAKGASVSAEISIAAAAPDFRWEVEFRQHRVVIDNPTPTNFGGCRLSIFHHGPHPLSSMAESERAEDGLFVPFRRLAARFIDAVRADGSMAPGFAEGLRVQELIAAAERSAREVRILDLDDH